MGKSIAAIVLVFFALLGRVNAQAWLWAKSAISIENENCKDVAVDLANNRVYSVGSFNGSLNNLPGTPSPLSPMVRNGIVLVSDTGGVYSTHFLLPSFQNLELNGAAVDQSGNLYLCGTFLDSADFRGMGSQALMLYTGGAPRMFVAKYDPSLNAVWAISDSLSTDSKAMDIDVANGRVVVVGAFNGVFAIGDSALQPSVGLDAFALGLNPADGSTVWLAGMAGNGDDQAWSVKTGLYGAYVGGSFQGISLQPSAGGWTLSNAQAGTTDAFVAAFRIDSGAVRWAQRAGGPGQDTCHGVSLDYANIYATGTFEGTADFGSAGNITSAGGSDAYFWTLDNTAGTSNWVKRAGGPLNDAGADIAADLLGNFYVLGRFAGSVTLGGSQTITATGSQGAFVARYRADGTFDNLAATNTNADQATPGEIVAGPSGVYISGSYTNSALDFGPSTLPQLPAAANDNFYSAKFGCGQLSSIVSSISLSDDSICAGESVILTVNPTDANLFYGLQETYTKQVFPNILQGNGGSLSFNIGPLFSSQSFDVFVMDSLTMCYDFISMDNFIRMGPPALPDLGPDLTICIGDSTALSPGNFSSFVWSNGDTTSALNVSAPGTYWVDVLTPFQCPGSDTLLLLNDTLPVNFVQDTVTCPNTAFTYDATGSFSFLWSTTDTGATATLPGPGTYWCEATNGTCVVQEFFLVGPLPTPSINLGADTSLCGNGGILLDGATVGTNTYLWSNGDTNASILVLATGNYALTITNSSSCTASDTVQVSIFPLPLVNVAGLPPVVCAASPPLSLLGSPVGGIFSGATNSANIDPGALGAGTFTFSYTFTDANQCTNSITQTFDVEAVPTVPNAGPDQTLMNVNSALLSGNQALAGQSLWTALGAGTILLPDSNSSPVTQLTPGLNTFVYTISGTVCPSLSDTVRITYLDQPLLIPTGFSPNGDGMNDFWTIENLDLYTEKEVIIFSRWGEKVFEAGNYDNTWSGLSSSGDPLGDDTYFYTLNLGMQGQLAGYVVLKR